VVLAAGIAEKLHNYFPDAEIDFLVRKGNESLFKEHPYFHEVLVWNKKEDKLKNLWKLLLYIRKRRYDQVINVQRFAATGLLTVFSGAKETIGFNKNPLSFLFTKKIKHMISTADKPKHEIERNNDLIEYFTDNQAFRPVLYPSPKDYENILLYKNTPYICVAPASVWFTKQYPKDKWISFIKKLPAGVVIYLLGGKEDAALCNAIQEQCPDRQVVSLAGKLSFLESAALMQVATMNYVNDSAPMHFASAMNAPVTAVYCSTLPSFGFGPLSDKKFIVEIREPLPCRPCGLHGFKTCPLGHFKCAHQIRDEQLLYL
jgi:heptosyltransferase-2